MSYPGEGWLRSREYSGAKGVPCGDAWAVVPSCQLAARGHAAAHAAARSHATVAMVDVYEAFVGWSGVGSPVGVISVLWTFWRSVGESVGAAWGVRQGGYVDGCAFVAAPAVGPVGRGLHLSRSRLRSLSISRARRRIAS